MPAITSIKPQRNKRRVNVSLNGRFAFGIDLENYVRLGLKIKQELSEDEVKGIIKKAEFQKIWDKLLKFVTLRPRSEKEIRDYFKRKKIPESFHLELCDKLKRLELINDEKFAQWWLEQRLEFKHKSKRELIFELRNKGLSKTVIEKALGVVSIDEPRSARKLLEKSGYRWQKLKPQQAKQKKIAFLLRKGFIWETVDQIVNKVVK